MPNVPETVGLSAQEFLDLAYSEFNRDFADALAQRATQPESRSEEDAVGVPVGAMGGAILVAVSQAVAANNLKIAEQFAALRAELGAKS